MKKLLFLTLFLLCWSTYSIAQTVTFYFNNYHSKRIADKHFPSELTYFPGSYTATLTFYQKEGEKSTYNLIYDYDGKTKYNMTASYDSEKTKEERIAWNNQNLNCYKTKGGDYYYIVGTSFKSLLEKKSYVTDSGLAVYLVKPKNGTITKYNR